MNFDTCEELEGFGIDFANIESLFDPKEQAQTLPDELSGFGIDLSAPDLFESSSVVAEVPEVLTPSVEPELKLEATTQPPDGLKSNQLKCSDGSIVTYNQPADPNTLKIFSPNKIEAGWWVDRDNLKTLSELIEDYTKRMEKYQTQLKEAKENKTKTPSKPDISIHMYLQIDTEFKFLKTIFYLQTIAELFAQEPRDHVFTQMNFLPDKTGEKFTFIFVHPNYAELVNGHLKRLGKDPLPILSAKDCDVFDFLRFVLKWDVKVKQATLKRLEFLPKLYLTLGAHNAEAELNLIFHKDMLNRVLNLQKSVGYERIEKIGKVVRCISEIRDKYRGDYTQDYVTLQREVNFNSDPDGYSACVRIPDTIKAQGIISLGNFAKASDYKLTAKDLLSKADKEDIVATFTNINRTGDVISYSLQDACNIEIQHAFKDRINEMAVELGWENKEIFPSLTIGATVDSADKASLAQYLKLEGENWSKQIKHYIEEECQPFTPRHIVQNSAHTRALLGKGFGGRIGQNQPTVAQLPRTFKMRKHDHQMIQGIDLKTTVKGKFKLRKINGKFDATIITDIDISGCYAESQRLQLFFFGRPIIGGLRTDTISKNQYLTLKQWLTSMSVNIEELTKKRDKQTPLSSVVYGELIPGNFSLFLNTPELKNSQDLIVSYLHPTSQDHSIIAKLLMDAMGGDKDAIAKIKQGYTKITTNKIDCGYINYDIIEWLFQIANPSLRDEILDNSLVLAFAIYPKSARIEPVKEAKSKEEFQENFDYCKANLEEIRANWEPTNTMLISGNNGLFQYGETYQDCHGWYGFTIGELVLNEYLSKRKVAQWVKKKCPLDLLYKLFCNTKFGVSISPLFNLSNIVVGNNITARARVLAWCMEKALNGFPTITDGCFFLINKILYPSRDPIDSRCINPDSPNSQLSRFHHKANCLTFDFTGEDKLHIYSFTTKEWLMKDGRLLLLCEVVQTNKQTKVVNTFDSLQPLASNYFNPNTKHLDPTKLTNIKPEKRDDEGKKWICTLAKEHITNLFPKMDVLIAPTTEIKVKSKDAKYDKLDSKEKTNDMVKVLHIPRKGMADFEIKNIYHSGSNHGMANYCLVNTLYTITIPEHASEKDKTNYLKQHQIILFSHTFEETKDESKYWSHTYTEAFKTNAFRGYESDKPHRAIVRDENNIPRLSERYTKENPAKDLLTQILNNPNKVNRQNVAIKLVSLSINEYKKNYKKYDELGLKPGDQFKRAILLTEFSHSLFKFKTSVQFFGWLDDIQRSKLKYGQSLEAFFIEKDNTLNYQKMITWCLEAIERGVIEPIKELSKEHKKRKTFSKINRFHPEFGLLVEIKEILVGAKHFNSEAAVITPESENDGDLAEDILDFEDV